MDILCNLVECDGEMAVCSAMISTTERKVCVFGTASVVENGRFIELAQARAIALARRILAEGLDAVDPADYATAVPHTHQPTVVPPTAMPDAAPASIPETDTPPTNLQPQSANRLPTPEPRKDETDLPEVNWNFD